MKLKHDIAHIDWLLDKSSLTQKLIEKSQGHFRVELLQQSIHAISFAEKRALGLSPRQWAVSREVILYGNQTPWVYARTVIPISTLKGALRRLYYLGNKPLGEALFADPSMKRESVEIAQFHCQHLPIAPAINAATWGRRSVFRLSNKPLLVSEIFLPDLFIDAS
jgi:chorismate--pyruvate lyase